MEAGSAEYVSRWARWRLSVACLEALKRRRGSRGAVGEFAGLVGVSRRSVERWLGCGVQSCNVNAERIVMVSMRLCPSEAVGVLEEDMVRHRISIEGMLRLRRGGVAVAEAGRR